MRDEYLLQSNIRDKLTKKLSGKTLESEIKKKILNDLNNLDRERFSWKCLYEEYALFYNLYENIMDIILFVIKNKCRDIEVN